MDRFVALSWCCRAAVAGMKFGTVMRTVRSSGVFSRPWRWRVKGQAYADDDSDGVHGSRTSPHRPTPVAATSTRAVMAWTDNTEWHARLARFRLTVAAVRTNLATWCQTRNTVASRPVARFELRVATSRHPSKVEPERTFTTRPFTRCAAARCGIGVLPTGLALLALCRGGVPPPRFGAFSDQRFHASSFMARRSRSLLLFPGQAPPPATAEWRPPTRCRSHWARPSCLWILFSHRASVPHGRLRISWIHCARLNVLGSLPRFGRNPGTPPNRSTRPETAYRHSRGNSVAAQSDHLAGAITRIAFAVELATRMPSGAALSARSILCRRRLSLLLAPVSCWRR